MSEQKVAELKARVKTIRNISNAPEIRELCDIITAMLSNLDQDKDKNEMGFSNPKTRKEVSTTQNSPMNDEEIWLWRKVDTILATNMPIHKDHASDKKNIISALKDAVAKRDKSRDQQIALAARLDELRKAKGADHNGDIVLSAWIDTSIHVLEHEIATLKQAQEKEVI